jgi:hypothetical protein
MHRIIIVAVFLLMPALLFATTIHVPADQPTIQAGIDAASAGDTVLVACGTYTWASEGTGNENGLIQLKNGIVLRSETGSPGCVVVDAEHMGGVLYGMDPPITTTVIGLTLTNSSGDCVDLHGAGNSAIFWNCVFTENDGTAVGCGIGYGAASFLDLNNCKIINNTGGGVKHLEGGFGIANCLIADNGGIAVNLFHAYGSIVQSTITGNDGAVSTGESYVSSWRSIFWANGDEPFSGNPYEIDITCSDIEGGWEGSGNINADPMFCTPEPINYYLHIDSPCLPENNPCGELMGVHGLSCGGPGQILVEVQPPEVGTGNWLLTGPADILVEGEGEVFFEEMPIGEYHLSWSDIDGWIPPNPNPDIQYLGEGELVVFSGEYTQCLVKPDGLGVFATIQSAIDSFPYCSGSTIFLDNGVFNGPGNCDLNFQGKSIVLASRSHNPDSCIIDCQGTESEPHRGFLFQSGETSEAVVDGITIMGGFADAGAAIKCESGSSPKILNCVLWANTASAGGAIFSENSSPTFENCTISFNVSPNAGAAFLQYSDPTFENCILSHSIGGSAVFGYESNPLLTCTDVVWNEGGDWVGCIADQQNLNGNFSNTPAFCDPETGDFRLQPGSPCLPWHNDCGVLVGALGEGDCSPTGAEELPSNATVALSAFPNPFNPHLTITFALPGETQGSLVVHDVSGRLVRMLKDGQFIHGTNEVVWNGRDDHGQDVASGVYFVRLLAEEHQESKKVVLLR